MLQRKREGKESNRYEIQQVEILLSAEESYMIERINARNTFYPRNNLFEIYSRSFKCIIMQGMDVEIEIAKSIRTFERIRRKKTRNRCFGWRMEHEEAAECRTCTNKTFGTGGSIWWHIRMRILIERHVWLVGQSPLCSSHGVRYVSNSCPGYFWISGDFM